MSTRGFYPPSSGFSASPSFASLLFLFSSFYFSCLSLVIDVRTKYCPLGDFWHKHCSYSVTRLSQESVVLTLGNEAMITIRYSRFESRGLSLPRHDKSLLLLEQLPVHNVFFV